MRASVHVHVVVWKIVLFLQVHVQYQKATCTHVYNMYIVHVCTSLPCINLFNVHVTCSMYHILHVSLGTLQEVPLTMFPDQLRA